LIRIDHACEEGFYDSLGHKTDMDAQYPSFQKVIDCFDNKERQVELMNESLAFYDSKIKCYTYSDNHQFNSTYVELLTKKIGLKHGYLCANKNGGDDILFFESDTKAKIQFVGCVMPLRVLKNDD
jgi:hypothetical protein